MYVYSLRDSSCPLAAYPESVGSNFCIIGIVADNHFYLGDKDKKLRVFKITDSITEPLILVNVIETRNWVHNILRVGNELLLCEDKVHLEVLDIATSTITNSVQLGEGIFTSDIAAIDETHFLFATSRGLLKASKNHLIKRYSSRDYV